MLGSSGHMPPNTPHAWGLLDLTPEHMFRGCRLFFGEGCECVLGGVGAWCMMVGPSAQHAWGLGMLGGGWEWLGDDFGSCSTAPSAGGQAVLGVQVGLKVQLDGGEGTPLK